MVIKRFGKLKTKNNKGWGFYLHESADVDKGAYWFAYGEDKTEKRIRFGIITEDEPYSYHWELIIGKFRFDYTYCWDIEKGSEDFLRRKEKNEKKSN